MINQNARKTSKGYHFTLVITVLRGSGQIRGEILDEENILLAKLYYCFFLESSSFLSVSESIGNFIINIFE